MLRRLSTSVRALALLASSGAFACTRILWNQAGPAVLVARTMDWPEWTEPVLTVLPRGLTHDGGKVGAEDLHDPNPEQWTTKYGSLVTTVDGLGAADGMNEQGLAAHMLYLNAADFGARNAKLPGVQAGLWAQYALDNAATVTQALEALMKIQPGAIEAHGHKANVHPALETRPAFRDRRIYRRQAGRSSWRDYLVMTNDPSYDQQLALLKGMEFSKPSSDMPLPGNVNPRDRFQRASYYLSMVPTPKSEREGVASMIAIARNVSVPFGAPYKSFGVYNTEYRSVSDPTNGLYFFELTTNPNLIWTDLKKLDFGPGAAVRTLNPNSIDLVGDVSADYRPAPAPY